MLRGMAILLLMQLAGEALSAACDLPIPGSVIGMGLLLAALMFGWVKPAWIDEAADLLLSHMALFFVPAGVGVMVHFDLIGRQWLPISVALVVSTFAVIAVTGHIDQALAARRERRRG